jgi:hypothetical protein
MICPVCKQSDARRSRRHSVADYVVSVVGVYPWRCRECHARFHARLTPLSNSFHAHCPQFGNFELQRISAEYVNTPLATLWGLLNVPALRCEPCRHKYFSLLPLRRPARSVCDPSSAD